MKKLIAILVVFALAMGAAFAEISVSGSVITNVILAESDDSKATDGEIKGSAGFKRIRLEASGANDEGTFGAWLRVGGAAGDEILNGMEAAYAWWKPIDQFLMRIGGNGGDGFYGKEGVTGWGFYQTASDTQVTFEGENVWGWGVTNGYNNFWDDGQAGFGALIKTRQAFYAGFGGNGLMLEIKPVEMFGINIVLPYFDGGLVEDIFAGLTIQFDLNLDFGNIAITYVGDGDKKYGDKKDESKTMGQVFVYAGIPIGDNVALDVGASMILPGAEEGHPIAVGAGVKVGISETFGLKARLTATLGGDKDKNDGDTALLFDVLPYFVINDLMTAFVSVGLTMRIPAADGAENGIGFHFNPYLQVGSEWGPKFLVGLKVWQIAYGEKYPYNGSAKDGIINWAIPIALNVGF